MCIRDSAKATGTLPASGEVTLQFSERALILSADHDGIIRRTLLCLLYTSDAADERSSVDLGGRRIIKKKNTVDIEDGTLIDRKTKHRKASERKREERKERRRKMQS